MLTISPSPGLRGTVSLPGDKSMSHRASLFAALAEGESSIDNFLDAGVTRRMLSALSSLGVSWTLDNGRLTVQGCGLGGLREPESPIDCGNSATTMRLLAGALSAAGIPAVLDGSAGLRRRPMGRIVRPLSRMGVSITAEGERAPMVFGGRASGSLEAGDFVLSVASAQVKTCLLLAGLAASGPTRILEPGPSRDHSERMLREMGAGIETTRVETPEAPAAYRTELRPTLPLRPLRMRLPGDFSSAAFLVTAALITPGSDLTILDVGLNPTRTGLLDAFASMRADIAVHSKGDRNGEPIGDLRVRASRLHGTVIAGPLVVRMIDEFPAFAVAAAFAAGETIVRDAGELRHKESDRISALCKQLQAIEVEIEEMPDGFRMPGNAVPAGGTVEPHGDHRIAMALACAGLASAGPVGLLEPEIIRESFPEFIPTLGRLGARID